MQPLDLPVEEAFRALGDPTRLRIVRLLAATHEEACLCEFVDSLLEPQYKLSRHLKILRQAGLLCAEKEGRWVYHRLASGTEQLETLYEWIAAIPDPDGDYAADRKCFEKRLAHREAGRCRVGVLTKTLKCETV
jgi:ArsR family transcriptional regulator